MENRISVNVTPDIGSIQENTKAAGSLIASIELQERTSISISRILELVAEWIDSTKRMDHELVVTQVNQSMQLLDVASTLAEKVEKVAKTYFTGQLVSGVAGMALTLGTTIKSITPKTVKAKHLKGSGLKLGDLSASEKLSFTAQLQNANTSKYNGIKSAGDTGRDVVKNGLDISKATDDSKNDKLRASREAQEASYKIYDQWEKNLREELDKLVEILNKVNEMSRASMRG